MTDALARRVVYLGATAYVDLEGGMVKLDTNCSPAELRAAIERLRALLSTQGRTDMEGLVLIRARKGRRTVHLSRFVRKAWWTTRAGWITTGCGEVIGTRLQAGEDDTPRCQRCRRAADPTKPRFGQMALRRGQ